MARQIMAPVCTTSFHYSLDIEFHGADRKRMNDNDWM